MHIIVALVITGYVVSCEVRAPDAWRNCDARWGMVIGWMFESPLTSFKTYLRKKQDPSTSTSDGVKDPTS
jgi:hypothetical protein